MQISRILVAVDESVHSANAARFAHSLAKTMGASLGVITAIDPAIFAVSADTVVYPVEQINDLKASAENIIDNIKEQLGADIPIESFIPEGKPSEEIINIATKWGADLIVLGTHGRTGFMHLIMGSVAESVIRHSTIPVLVVPTKEKE